LRAFWNSVEQNTACIPQGCWSSAMSNAMANWITLVAGIPTFFIPNPAAFFGPHALVGIEHASYYSTEPLRNTLAGLVDFAYLNSGHTRISLGAVKIGNGEMRYFDSGKETLRLEHVMASGALPPAFPAIRVDDSYYWDGGLYSNTPIEAVLEDNPRRDSIVFAVDIWNPAGTPPKSLWQVAGREKDIQYASRASSHIARQKQIHHMRHIILELVKAIPENARDSPEIRELASWGCKTTMHIARLLLSGIPDEDHMKDMDFGAAGIRARWQSGHAHARRMLDIAPWARPVDPLEGIIIHDLVVSEEGSLTDFHGVVEAGTT
jgi:NTE family protein